MSSRSCALTVVSVSLVRVVRVLSFSFSALVTQEATHNKAANPYRADTVTTRMGFTCPECTDTAACRGGNFIGWSLVGGLRRAPSCSLLAVPVGWVACLVWRKRVGARPCARAGDGSCSHIEFTPAVNLATDTERSTS